MAELKTPADDVYGPLNQGSFLRGYEQYQALHKRSIEKNDEYWGEMASKLTWFKPYSRVQSGSFESGTMSWFLDGKLNVSYNCLDRHAATKPDSLAIIWEGNETSEIRKVTYAEALSEVCRIANALRAVGIKKGDRVALYMPMVPEAAYAMLACARLGAPHIVVFGGFSASSLRDRIVDSEATVIITADEGLRGPKPIPLKTVVDEALKECPTIKTCFVMKRTGNKVPWTPGRDVWLHEAMDAQRGYCPAEVMDSEDLLFLLHTSGSTGKPKGLAHTTGGYLTFVNSSFRHVFDYQAGDVFACMADIGWVTGHSYIVYGPLSNGGTTFMFESLPTYPDEARYWDMVERHKITQFYTAPTALRALMKAGDKPVLKHDLSSLRILGSVGEPINPEAWRWYFNVVGKGKCSIVDTYWQTETGGILASAIPGATALKPGACGTPYFGIDFAVLDEKGNEIQGNGVTGALVIKRPWPGIARTVWGDHSRYRQTYFSVFNGYYFTGDRTIRDKDGYYWVTGRLDDVMNVSGHRIGSAEVESALVEHKGIAEAAVVGIAHELKGQGLVAYVTPKEGAGNHEKLLKELNAQIRSSIGGFAIPEMIVLTNALPKTRSGKIMRRLLRKVAEGDTTQLGDITTLADPGVVTTLIDQVASLRNKPKSKL